MTPDRAGVFGGVDTHKDVHVAAAVDAAGRLLGTAEFAADSRGYDQLAGWLESWGAVGRVGVECQWPVGSAQWPLTGSLGVPLAAPRHHRLDLRRMVIGGRRRTLWRQSRLAQTPAIQPRAV